VVASAIREHAPDVGESLARLRRVGAQLCSEFVDKDGVIDLIAICAIAQEPLLLLGPPGTAKSALLTRFCELIGLHTPDYFRYLLTAFTEPDELLGVVNIRKYMDEHNPQFLRWDKGSVQKARIVFLDEVFRANSAILNTLLSIINERVYYEAGEAKPANTRIVYGASNDVPRSYDLCAFYARFPVRVDSDYVQPDGNKRLRLLQHGWRLEVDAAARRDGIEQPTNGYAASNGSEPLCTFADLEACQRALYTATSISLDGGDDQQAVEVIQQAYADVVSKLNLATDLFAIDDRKFIKLFKLILARALMRGGDARAIQPSLEDVCFILQHAWEDPELAELAASNVLDQVKQVDAEYASKLSEQQRLPEALRRGTAPA
jgi:MoxR-like ATPase